MANEVKIEGNLNATFETLKSESPKYFRAALMAGAEVLINNAKQALINEVPAATQQSPRYNDTLVDAVVHGKLYDDEITVNILGRSEPGSGAYRTRFFENGTQDRYQKKRNGVKLKKKKYLGKIPPTHFFQNSISSSEQQATAAMEVIINNLFDKYNNK